MGLGLGVGVRAWGWGRVQDLAPLMLLAVADVGHLRHLGVFGEVDRNVLGEDARLVVRYIRGEW